jgi:hypothetical protein
MSGFYTTGDVFYISAPPCKVVQFTQGAAINPNRKFFPASRNISPHIQLIAGYL